MILTVAVVGPAHGLRGEVILDVRTDVPQQRFYPGAKLAILDRPGEFLTVESLRSVRGRALAAFAEITTRQSAQDHRGLKLVIDSEQDDTGVQVQPAPLEHLGNNGELGMEADPEPGYYPHQLAGLSVRGLAGEDLGVIKTLRLGAAQDLLVVNYCGQEILVPFVRAIAVQVDLESRVVIVDPPGGMFEVTE